MRVPDQVFLKRMFEYDPETGLFTRRVTSGGQPSGTIAGHLHVKGMIKISVAGRLFSAHRLAWVYQTGAWPEKEIDHADGNPANNRWKNLRLADRSQNCANKSLNARSASGFKGVTKHGDRWRASIKKHQKQFHIGVFDTPEQAHAAYLQHAEIKHGQFARAR